MDEPRLIEGGLSVDDRGIVSYVNGFDFEGVKRFYMVQNHSKGFIRAWHAHRHETKYVMVTMGIAIVGAVPIDDWTTPSQNVSVKRFVLTGAKPSIFRIPKGWANGFMTLTENTNLIFFSNKTVEESEGDDYRYPFDYWDIWSVEQR